MEVARSRRRRRSRGQDLAIQRSRVHAAVTQQEVAARLPTETETEAQAMRRISPRESHVHGESEVIETVTSLTNFPISSDRSRSEEKNDKSRSRSASPARRSASPERNNESNED